MIVIDNMLNEEKLERLLSQPFVGTCKPVIVGKCTLTTIHTLGGVYDLWVNEDGEVVGIF